MYIIYRHIYYNIHIIHPQGSWGYGMSVNDTHSGTVKFQGIGRARYCISKKSCPFVYSELLYKIDIKPWTHSIYSKSALGDESHRYINMYILCIQKVQLSDKSHSGQFFLDTKYMLNVYIYSKLYQLTLVKQSLYMMSSNTFK